ncbi:MAG: PAS domain S-box protein [Melioribacteraceae bacterium]|nr:PAS domain S-box protein [Melioribacteraceae bacterium]
MPQLITENISKELKRVKRYSNFISLVWVILIALSLFWNLYSVKIQSEDIAKSNARAYFEKEISFRNWAASHGGLYVPLTKRTPANPYLAHIPNREIELSPNDTLTLLNPAYILRQIHEEESNFANIIGHLTSLNPKRLQNAADNWEQKALFEFEKGIKEVYEFKNIGGKEYLKLMKPLITKESCLKCHASQGYEVGDIRGGLSVSVLMKPIWATTIDDRIRIIALHLSMIIVGFIGIRTTSKRFTKKIIATHKVKEKLLVKDERLKLALGTTNAGVWDWNILTREAVFDERWAEISGYTLAELEPTDIDTWNRLVHPNDLPELDLMLEKHYENESEHYEFETRMKHKNGDWIWVLIMGKVIERDDENKPIRMVGVVADITKRKKSEELIKNANTQFSLIMNSLDALVFVSDLETYELLFVNKALSNIVGDVTGKICWQAIQKNQGSPCKFCKSYKLFNIDGELADTYTWEFQNTINNRWYLVKDRAIRWHDGRIVHLQIATDINESKKTKEALQESEKRFRTTFNNAIDPTFIAEISEDSIPLIYDVNKAVLKIFGYTKKELIGKPMAIIHADGKKEDTLKNVKALLSGKQINFESLSKKKDNSFIHVERSAKRIKINNKYYIYIVERDISERNKWKKEILKARQILEEENANKDKFFSIISHDLKAPFSALLGISQLLEEDYDEMDNLERKELIRITRNCAKNIYELLDGLLEWSRAKSGRMDFTPSVINLHDASLQVIHVLIQNAKNKNINLVNIIESDSTAYVDEKMFRTILRNLVANAIKFTTKGGEIIISSKTLRDKIEISVSDNGIGMSSEQIDKLFRIEICHTTLGTDSESGTGVGLILCKELVEINTGNIWVESELGKGSSFKFTLPNSDELEKTNLKKINNK